MELLQFLKDFDFLAFFSGDRMIALFVAILALTILLKVAKVGIKIFLGCVLVLAALYFLAPGLYAEAISAINSVWSLLPF